MCAPGPPQEHRVAWPGYCVCNVRTDTGLRLPKDGSVPTFVQGLNTTAQVSACLLLHTCACVFKLYEAWHAHVCVLRVGAHACTIVPRPTLVGSGHGMAEMVWSPWQRGRSWVSWDSLGSKEKKKKPKPLNTKRLGREKELEGWEGGKAQPPKPQVLLTATPPPLGPRPSPGACRPRLGAETQVQGPISGPAC